MPGELNIWTKVMNCTVIDKNAEDLLYASILANEHDSQANAKAVSTIEFLQCRFFQIGMTPDIADIEQIMKALPLVDDSTIYICNDGDLVLTWFGNTPEAYVQLIEKLIEKYEDHIKKYMKLDDFFVNYTWLDGREKLKAECFRKLKKQTKHSKLLAKYFDDERLIDTLKKTVQMTQMQRAFRANPHILIVEDQVFSQKILMSILKDYTCHLAENAGEALLKYMEKCPDIVFLDIDLPDLSGHSFANFINKIDRLSYVVMVTANQYETDIKTAKENNVKGFIGKPYEKEVILKAVEQFKKTRNKKKKTAWTNEA